jgi:hypothetical protein
MANASFRGSSEADSDFGIIDIDTIPRSPSGRPNVTADPGSITHLIDRAYQGDADARSRHARNAQEARIHWTFTLAVARQKLRKLNPSNEDG